MEFDDDSDESLLDIPALQDDFSALFGGRKVDLATPGILDNPFRRKMIMPELRTLYAARFARCRTYLWDMLAAALMFIENELKRFTEMATLADMQPK